MAREAASQQQMRQALRQLARHAHATSRLCGAVWVDEVRQDAEVRMGLGPTAPGVLDDPEYGTALDVFSELEELHARVDGLSRGMFG